MDTSETYIKMCEKAEEIQKQSPINEGGYHEWYVCNTHHEVMEEDSGTFFHSSCPDSYGQGKVIWLPRQDQLQEMLLNSIPKDEYRIYEYENRAVVLLMDFSEWVKTNKELFAKTKHTNISMEQPWLGFVEKEKFHKVWDGKEWVLKD